MILATFIMSTSFVFADCSIEVKKAFSQENPRFSVHSIEQVGSLGAGEREDYYQSAIVNKTDKELSIYNIESFFMVEFVYVALVDESNCEVVSLSEVGMR